MPSPGTTTTTPANSPSPSSTPTPSSETSTTPAPSSNQQVTTTPSSSSAPAQNQPTNNNQPDPLLYVPENFYNQKVIWEDKCLDENVLTNYHSDKCSTAIEDLRNTQEQLRSTTKHKGIDLCIHLNTIPSIKEECRQLAIYNSAVSSIGNFYGKVIISSQNVESCPKNQIDEKQNDLMGNIVNGVAEEFQPNENNPLKAISKDCFSIVCT